MSYLADLAEEGDLLAVGALSDDDVCGLSILGVDPKRACELMEGDPAVQAGAYNIWAVPWKGARAGDQHLAGALPTHDRRSGSAVILAMFQV
jgi:hypothetical protein